MRARGNGLQIGRRVGGRSAGGRRAVAACVALLGVSAVLGGCSSGPRIVENGAIGHPISIDASAWVYLLRAELPHPGWSLELDEVRLEGEVHEAFVTVREPDPAKMYTQQIVTKSVGLGVTANEPLRVYARQVAFSSGSGGGAGTRYVAAGTHGLTGNEPGDEPIGETGDDAAEGAGTGVGN